MTAKDAALREFDGHVLRLAQIINRAEPSGSPGRAWTYLSKLSQLSLGASWQSSSPPPNILQK